MLRNPPNTQGQCWVVMKSLVIVRFAGGGRSSGFEFFLVRRGRHAPRAQTVGRAKPGGSLDGKYKKMKPIEIKIVGHVQKSSPDICTEFLDTERWSEFEGYSILPGIKNAHFEVKTPGFVGSRIKVQNKDGSSHIEEIIEWDVTNRIELRFQEFNSPLQNLATHFIETWEFRKSSDGTEVSRIMAMYPRGLFGWFMLIPISKLMKKAFEKNLRQTSNK